MHRVLNKQQAELFHTDRETSFNVKQLFRVIHLEITEKPARDCICCILRPILYVDIVCKVSEHTASKKR